MSEHPMPLGADAQTSTVDLGERRRRRSANALVAMSYQLEQVMQDFDLDGCVLATEDGLLFARPEQLDADLAQEYAAYATPLLAPVLARQHHTTHRLSARVYAHVQQLWVWEQPLMILAIGQSEASAHLACHRAVQGVMRIVKESQAPSGDARRAA